MILKKNKMGQNLRKSSLFLIFEDGGQILIFFSKMVTTSYAKRNKLYSFEEEVSHQKSENCTHPPPPYFRKYLSKRKKIRCGKYHQTELQSAKL